MSIKLTIGRREDGPGSQRREVKDFDGPMVTIGADPASSLHLDDPAVALEQAVLIAEKDQWLLITQATGTILNGEPLAREARRPLKHGDLLRAGSHVISVGLNKGPQGGAARRDEPDGAHAPDTRTAAGTSADEDVPPTQAEPPEAVENASRNFSKILESLRTVEDSFYFLVEGGANSGRRVPIDTMAMLLGWDALGRDITFEAGAIATPRAVVRKEWRGVFVQPVGGEAVAVNGERVESERRLNDGDRLTLVSQAPTRGGDPFLIFHVPATLDVLDSLYRPKLDTALAPKEDEPEPAGAGAGAPEAGGAPPRAGLSSPGRKYFRHFTILDLLLMCVATLVAAGIFFLVLIYWMPVR